MHNLQHFVLDESVQKNLRRNFYCIYNFILIYIFQLQDKQMNFMLI